MKFKNIFNTAKGIEEVKKAAEISVRILSELKDNVVKDSSPLEVDKIAEELCKKNGVKAAFNGVPGPISDFPASSCISVNDETLHTIPDSKREFRDGDLVSVDFGIIYNGIYTDHCFTVGIGNITKEDVRLIETTRLAVDTAIKQAIVGNHVGDISNALQSIAEMGKFDYIRGYAGHGIGDSLWLDPSIPYHGEKGDGPELQEGMLLCVELQLSHGTGNLKIDENGWTLRTKDGSKTAMFEHMVLVRNGEPEVLTRMD